MREEMTKISIHFKIILARDFKGDIYENRFS